MIAVISCMVVASVLCLLGALAPMAKLDAPGAAGEFAACIGYALAWFAGAVLIYGVYSCRDQLVEIGRLLKKPEIQSDIGNGKSNGPLRVEQTS